MNRISRRRFLKIAGLGAGAAAVGAGTSGGLRAMARRPAAGENARRPDVLRHLLLEVQRAGPCARRPALEDHRPPGRSAVPRSALPARHRRHRRLLRPGPAARPADAPQGPRRGSVGRGYLGRSARPHRRTHAEDQGRTRSRSDGALQPRHRRHVPEAHAQGVRQPEHRRTFRSRSAAGPRDVGFELTFGEGIGSPERTDIANARCLVLVGSHLGENMHNTQVQEFADAVAAGAAIIVADPASRWPRARRSNYLPVSRAPTLHLLLAWIERDRHGRPLRSRVRSDQHGFGFEHFRRRSRRARRSGPIPNRHRAGVDPRDGARHGVPPPRDTGAPGPAHDLVRRRRAARTCHCIAERAARQLGAQGRLLLSIEHGRAELPLSALPRVGAGQGDNPDHRYPFASEAITTGIREATLTGQPYPVKGWLVYATNLIHAMPTRPRRSARSSNST